MVYVAHETLDLMRNMPMNEETLRDLVAKSHDKGIITVNGSVSYVQQVPWIMNKTI